MTTLPCLARLRPLQRLLAAVALLALGLVAVRAHGDDQLLIDALTEELARKPDADLFIRRGELFRHHQDWARAEQDFGAAARLDPKLAVVDYFRARVLLESGQTARAEPFIAKYVEAVPDEAEGWFLRGDIARALEQVEAADAHYGTGIRLTPRPRPEHYLKRAQLLSAAGPGHAERALAVLNAGIERLGPVISLVDMAITLELDARNFEAALQRVRLAMEHAPRRETWLVRQGDILLRAGRAAEAAGSYQAALAAIDGLPERYRTTVPVQKLVRDAQQALAGIAAEKATR